MIRALHVINSLAAAGAETLLVQLCHHLPAEGVEPVVASLLGPGPLSPLLAEQGTRTIDLSRGGSADLFAIGRLVREIRRSRIDIVHTHLAYAGVAGKLAAAISRRPAVMTRHSTTAVKSATPFYRLEDRLTRTGTTRVVAISEYMRRFIVASGLAGAGRVVVQRNAIDLDRFRKLVRETERSGGPIIGTVGRMEPPKAHEVFLEAMAIIRENISTARGVLVGEGSRRLELEAIRHRLGLDDVVSFPGAVAPTEVPTLLNAFDVFVLSSDWEGLPIVLIEAAALGVPVVATNITAVPEAVMDGETGFLVPRRNPRALADAVMAILRSPKTAARFAAKAQAVADAEFDVGRLARQTASLYREVLAEWGVR